MITTMKKSWAPPCDSLKAVWFQGENATQDELLQSFSTDRGKKEVSKSKAKAMAYIVKRERSV